MLKRCYSEELKEKYKTYADCYVNPYFLNFQNFAKWFDNNYYEIDNETMCLDKDILIKGNKEYAPNKCVFVPQRINTLFINCSASRGELPLGVVYNKRDKTYTAQCSILTVEGHKLKHIGNFSSPKLAFLAYKDFKESYIKQIAEEYRSKIPLNLYTSMYLWEVYEDD